jgi:DNA invertase Pin-like site-specific DNA recombinase
MANQERLRLSERVVAGLERARKQGRVGGRPKIRRDRDKDAAKIRQLREDGQSYGADELGRSRSDIARVARSLNCTPANGGPVMAV